MGSVSRRIARGICYKTTHYDEDLYGGYSDAVKCVPTRERRRHMGENRDPKDTAVGNALAAAPSPGRMGMLSALLMALRRFVGKAA